MRYLLPLSLLLFVDVSLSASFNCEHPKLNSVEKMICDSSQTSLLDDHLSLQYSFLMRKDVNRQFGSELRDLYKSDQVKWIRSRNSCKTLDCIDASYTKRIATLKNEINKSKKIVSKKYLGAIFNSYMNPTDEYPDIDSNILLHYRSDLNISTFIVRYSGTYNYSGPCGSSIDGYITYFRLDENKNKILDYKIIGTTGCQLEQIIYTEIVESSEEFSVVAGYEDPENGVKIEAFKVTVNGPDFLDYTRLNSPPEMEQGLPNQKY